MVHVIPNAYLRADDATDSASETKSDTGLSKDLTSKVAERARLYHDQLLKKLPQLLYESHNMASRYL